MDLSEIQKKVSEFAKFLVNNAKEEEKEPETEIENEKTDKRKLIDEVAGMMKSAGCDDEVIRTAIGKMEKIGYDESEAGTADNKKDKKAVKNEDDEDEKKYKDLKKDVKEDVENKCGKKDVKNSIDNSGAEYFNKLNEVYNSAEKYKQQITDNYVSRADRLKAGSEYFKAATE